jgi:acid stress-induced BolA-like protein IbaG/YrbA
VLSPATIEGYIREELDCTYLAVQGDGTHFDAVIVSPSFSGKSRVQRHQIVYAALGERMCEEIHALSMRTLSPDEWAADAH